MYCFGNGRQIAPGALWGYRGDRGIETSSPLDISTFERDLGEGIFELWRAQLWEKDEHEGHTSKSSSSSSASSTPSLRSPVPCTLGSSSDVPSSSRGGLPGDCVSEVVGSLSSVAPRAVLCCVCRPGGDGPSEVIDVDLALLAAVSVLSAVDDAARLVPR